jgi:photosystem II stability/assembly factor-like uncharacterized protein
MTGLIHKHPVSGRILNTVILFTISVFAFSCKKDLIQPETVEQITTAAKGDLNRIVFINDTLGYIAGGNRYLWSDILTTHDGGKTWQLFFKDDSDGKEIYGLSAFGDRTYGVSFDGKIFIKNGSGGDWNFVQTGWWEWFQEITFTEANKGFIVAGIGYRNGRIFQVDSAGGIVKVDSFEYELSDIIFHNTQIGYASGYGAILKTEDAGNSWKLQDIRGDFFKGICTSGAQNVWAVGYNGSIVHSNDGGAHWERQRNGDNPLLKRYRLRAVAFRNDREGYAVGDKGLIIKTTDAGAHWVEMEQVTEHDLRCITLNRDGSIWVAGAAGVVLRIKE